MAERPPLSYATVAGHRHREPPSHHLPIAVHYRRAYACISHLYILILQRFNVEPDGGYGLDGLVGLILQPVEDGGLPGIVEAEDQYSNLLGTEETLEESAH